MLTCQRVAALRPTGQAQLTQGGGTRLVQQKALHTYEIANLLRALAWLWARVRTNTQTAGAP